MQNFNLVYNSFSNRPKGRKLLVFNVLIIFSTTLLCIFIKANYLEFLKVYKWLQSLTVQSQPNNILLLSNPWEFCFKMENIDLISFNFLSGHQNISKLFFGLGKCLLNLKFKKLSKEFKGIFHTSFIDITAFL